MYFDPNDFVGRSNILYDSHFDNQIEEIDRTVFTDDDKKTSTEITLTINKLKQQTEKYKNLKDELEEILMEMKLLKISLVWGNGDYQVNKYKWYYEANKPFLMKNEKHGRLW